MSIYTKKPATGPVYIYSPPLLPGLDGFDAPQGTQVRITAGPGVGRAPKPFAYVETLDGKFLGMTTIHCLQRVKKERTR